MPARDYYLPTRSLVSQEASALLDRPDVPRSKFTGSWNRKTTLDAGPLYPFLVEEILPGDHISYNVTAMLRMATALFPTMSNFLIETFFFFVPNRLVWTNWEKFMGDATVDQSDQAIAYTIPQLTMPTGGFAVNGLYDALGLPTVGQVDAAGTGSVNALPVRAYALIYNDWFRDQNVIDKIAVNVDDGPDVVGDVTLRNRAKAHDYFTSCLPWAQKFSPPSVTIGGLAPVQGLGIGGNQVPTGGPINIVQTLGDLETYDNYVDITGAVGKLRLVEYQAGEWTPQLYADLTQGTGGITINELRETFLIQQMLERDARGGTRYIEKILAAFGVKSPDARLQRPEYIGGGSTPLNVSPIAQTAPSATDPVGTLGGTGTAAGQHRASYAATEHGYILGLINVRSELAYQQGLHKMWTRTVPVDFYDPMLAGLGEQAVTRGEIYFRGTTDDDIVFGYQERWQEYRTRTSEVTGYFKSTTANAIDQWHTVQDFGSAPVLGQTFIEDYDNERMYRVLAAGSATAGQQFLADIYIQRQAVRPLPAFGTPVMLGKF